MRTRESSFYWKGCLLDFTRYYVLHVDKSGNGPRYTLLDMGDNCWLQFSEETIEFNRQMDDVESGEGWDFDPEEFF